MSLLLTLIILLVAIPSWGFDVAVRRFALTSAVTGIQAFTFPDFGEDCTVVSCAAIFIVTRATTEDTHAADAMLSIGFADGTNQVVTFVHDDNAASPSDGVRSMRNDRVIESQETTGVTGIAMFYDWTTTGLRIDTTDAFPAAYFVTIVIIGGDEILAKVGTFTSNATLNGTTDVNTVGFEPDAVLLSSARLATVNSSATSYVWSMGSAVNDGSSTQGSISCYSEHGASATFDARALTSSAYAIQTVTSTGLGTAVEVGGWDAQGFTATTRETGLSAANHYLALNLGGASSTVLDIDTRTTLGLSSHTLGYKPLFGMVLGTLAQAYGTLESDSDGGQCMISLFTENNQYATGVSVQDGSGATTTTYSISNDQGIVMESNVGTCDPGTCFRGHEFVENTSFDLNYTSVFTSAVRKWIGFAIENETIAGARRRGPGLLQ